MPEAVFCIAHSEEHADRIIDRLENSGFGSSDISVLFLDRGIRSLSHGRSSMMRGDAGTGTLMGAAMGWLNGIGLLSIPGVGRFIAAGPIMATLSHARVGGAGGSLTGSLVAMGMPRMEAKRYEERVRDGNILISVHSESMPELLLGRRILEDIGAEDISSAGGARARLEAAGSGR